MREGGGTIVWVDWRMVTGGGGVNSGRVRVWVCMREGVKYMR